MTEKRFREVVSIKTIKDNQTGIAYIPCLVHDDFLELVNNLAEENEELKQRNNNQYNQLNQLWQLIQAKDWETLTTMDNQMKENDERLKREWKCYE